MDPELSLLLVMVPILILIGLLIYFYWKTPTGCPTNKYIATWTPDCKPATCVDPLAKLKDKCVRYHKCDPQYGPDYSTGPGPLNDGRAELIKTFTADQCLSRTWNLCWDDDLEKCFDTKHI
jgi:hypothetical protein